MFRIKLDTTNYNKIVSPSKTAILMRENMLKKLENSFWISEIEKLVGDDIHTYYRELDAIRDRWASAEIPIKIPSQSSLEEPERTKVEDDFKAYFSANA